MSVEHAYFRVLVFASGCQLHSISNICRLITSWFQLERRIQIGVKMWNVSHLIGSCNLQAYCASSSSMVSWYRKLTALWAITKDWKRLLVIQKWNLSTHCFIFFKCRYIFRTVYNLTLLFHLFYSSLIQEPLEDSWNGRLLGYIVRHRLDGYPNNQWTSENITNVRQTSYTITGLLTWQRYEIQVAAYNGAGVGTFSSSVREQTYEGSKLKPVASYNGSFGWLQYLWVSLL